MSKKPLSITLGSETLGSETLGSETLGSRVRNNGTFSRWTTMILLMVTILVPAGFLDCSVFAQDADDPGIARLELKFERPRQITVFGGKGYDLRPDGVPESGRTYWYLRYTVENKSGIDGTFYVGIKARSDKNRRYANIALPWVEDAIERKEGKMLFSRGDLLATNGAGDLGLKVNAGDKKECVAIFNAIDPEADNITVDFHGLVDDIEVEETAGGNLKLMERVLRLDFHRPGDEFYTSMDLFRFKKKSWIRNTLEFSGPDLTPVKQD